MTPIHPARRAVSFVACAALALALSSCGHKSGPTSVASAEPAAAASASAAPSAAPLLPVDDEPVGDAERGKALVNQLECGRCHQGTGTAGFKMEKECFNCHVQIVQGKFKGPKGSEARWHDRVLDLQDVPSLTSSQKRFRRTWITHFLLEPYDMRPRLGPTMPRLPITREQARDIAAYLGMPDDPAAKPDFSTANPARGKKLMEDKGCPSCHVFSGAPPFEDAPKLKPDEKGNTGGVALAPDLRHARDRVRPEALIAWITNAKALKPDTAMPEYVLEPGEARDIAAYILLTPLAKAEPKPRPARLPVPPRPVKYDEVSEKVFKRTCWHCHGEPDYAAGDGGPGNTGGFGFKPRGINFVDYASVGAGMVDDSGTRHSLFEKTADGTPRIIRALLARQDEESGKPDAQVRGMPLGYPSLSPEDIQLVESWVAQGRPR